MSKLKAGDLFSLCYYTEKKQPESFVDFEKILPDLEREHPEWVKAYRKLRKAERRFEEATKALHNFAMDMEETHDE
jgi:hypothetical protein